MTDRQSIVEYLARRSGERDLTAEAAELEETVRRKAREAAEFAVKNRVSVSVTDRGRVRKNGPCPCGSGQKFKRCCLREVQDPNSDKKLPSPKAMRAYIKRRKT